MAEHEISLGTASQMLATLTTSAAGLDTATARSRLAQYGPNDAAAEKRQPLALQFLAKFRNPLIIILLAASALSAVTGDVPSFLIIAVIVLLSTILDFVQETRAQSAIDALRRSVAVQGTVRRDGKAVSLPIDQLVPGDIVELIAGDLIPADCRLLESRDLYVNEALLTGEPYPAEKLASDNPAKSDGNPVGAPNAVFSGTSVISGTAVALVCLTGAKTALGHLATSLSEKPPATEFAIGIRKFGLLIMRFTVFMVLFVVLVNIAFHRPLLESLMFAAALAVGLTPELMPMIVTVTLARSALQMSKRRVIVKRLSAIHDLGAMDMLCTDKTGTLTEAKISLVRTIDGHGADCEPAYTDACINSRFESGMKSPLDDAIVSAKTCDISAWTKIDEVPFDFERRRISVLVEHAGERRLIVKGAPEDVLRLSGQYLKDGVAVALDAETRRAFETTLEGLGKDGFRALGVASRVVDAKRQTAAISDEIDLVFSGFAVFLDPPKPSAGETIRAMQAAGVAVKVLTGDNEQVSRNVFKQIGVPVTGVLAGTQLESMSDEALIGALPSVNLFCRINPQQKHRVLLALKRLGHVVGYMGDGINDAPALHAADVGISVDGAADVARAAADLIMLDHDLAVLKDAIATGRGAVLNVSKYVLMGASSNFGNMFSMAGAALLLPFLPMLPIQILLNNLIYNVSEIAIPFDRVDAEIITGPVAWDMRMIQRFMLVFGPISSVFDFLTFYAMLALFGAQAALFQTGWFVESMTTQLLVVFCIRTRRVLFRSMPGRFLIATTLSATVLAILLPILPVGAWFGFVSPPPLFYAYLTAATIGYLGLVELAKIVFYRTIGRQAASPARTA